MKKEKIYLSSPHMSGLEKQFIDEAFKTNWIAPVGENITSFEKEMCSFVETKASLAVSSGTAAIHLALKSVNVKKDDLVFCSTLTFVASCNPILYEEAIPVFIDSEAKSWNMSTVALKKAFEDCEKHKKFPKAVIVVNLYGQSANFSEILKLCNKYNVPIIEDAAESLGATYRGKSSGTIGEFGIYSFNGNKIITTSSGGMLISDDEKSINKARFWSTQSKDNEMYYQHSEIGYNYRMSNVLAGIGRGQLKILKERINQKKSIYYTYKEAFKDIEDIEMMPICDYGEPNYWISAMTIKKNSKVLPLDLILSLKEENIESRHIWKPMHLQPIYKNYKFYSECNNIHLSVSEDIFNRGICLPSDTKMNKYDKERIIKIIKNVFS